ncbi:MAG: hypothetical protein HYV63_25800 [Candidatus Schekmanbacteria bacterium]|nr:hypothetical protein [Candidatus Schekmanbacteria bacterium]
MVADKNMESALRGILSREEVRLVLGTAPFLFDPRRDLLVAAGQNDPGLYTRASEILQPYAGSWKHAVVLVDAEWQGSPGADQIQQRLNEHLVNAGWADGDGLGLVVDPEIDLWLWSDSPHTPVALGWPSWIELREMLERESLLKPGQLKPERPKEAAERALRLKRKVRSSLIYEQISSRVSIRRCQEPAVLVLLETLQRWFPPGGAEGLSDPSQAPGSGSSSGHSTSV